MANHFETSAIFGMEVITYELNLMLKECDQLVQHYAAETAAVKAKICELLHRLQSITKPNKEEAGNLLRQYTKVVLDMTYIKENQLVEDEFPVHDGYNRMQRILESLQQPQHVIYKLFCPNTYAQVVLGKEMAECLQWRRGALCYMYCHTLWENRERVDQNRQQFLMCLKEGVKELQAMLAMRNPISPESGEVDTSSQDTLSLARQGLFSDTHVLALMYAGEMCYWHKQLRGTINQSNLSRDSTLNQSDASKNDATGQISTHEGSTTSNPNKSSNLASSATQTVDINDSDFDSQRLGLRFLQQFVEVVKGPLRSAGWDCNKAEEMMKKLQN